MENSFLITILIVVGIVLFLSLIGNFILFLSIKDKSKESEPLFFRVLNYISIIISVTSLIAVVQHTNIYPSENSKIELVATFIGICTTFIIGFQIYSILDLKANIKKMKEEQRNLDLQNKSINKKIDYLDELAKDFQTKADSVTVNTAILIAQHFISEKKWSNALITCLKGYYQNYYKSNISQELCDLIQLISTLNYFFKNKMTTDEGFYFDKDEYESIVRFITAIGSGPHVDQISAICKELKFDLNKMFNELLFVISSLHVKNRNKSSSQRG